MSLQNDIESLKDLMGRGQMTAAQANVELVRIQRVRLITNSLPQDVRHALNQAVKRTRSKRHEQADERRNHRRPARAGEPS